MSSEYRIEVRNVNKVFYTHHFFQRDGQSNPRRFYLKKTVHAARQVNFQIRPGEIFGLLGPNGAGKTTCVKMVSGLIRPTAGSVYVEGMNVEKQRSKVLRKVGVVLEGTRTSIWPLTPLENLSYYGNLKDVRGATLRKRSVELLEFIGLGDKMNVQVRKLSRGQKQKVAICIALIADPPVLLLDEPTTGLDVQSSRSIKDKIIEMTREHGKSVLVTTHDMHVAQELCDRIGIIKEGAMVACKPTADLISFFSDYTFVLKLDRAPETGFLSDIVGVENVSLKRGENGPSLELRMTREPASRSEGLYTVFERLRVGGFQLKSISQREQNLENVFLHLTSDGVKEP